jgi:hypothetical protein
MLAGKKPRLGIKGAAAIGKTGTSAPNSASFFGVGNRCGRSSQHRNRKALYGFLDDHLR